MLIKKKIPSSVEIGKEKFRKCWWKLIFPNIVPSIAKDLFGCYKKLQPNKDFRPKSKVHKYLLDTDEASDAFGLPFSELEADITYLENDYHLKVDNLILISWSEKSYNLKIMFKTQLSSEGQLMEPQINRKELRMGRALSRRPY